MLKVVVVEDEELSRKGIILATDWASVGCVVVGDASDGEQGLEVIRRLKPDLIVTDIKMPKRNGLDMLRQLREEGSDAKVIILTAYGEFEYARAALQLGAADYLLKPFRDGELEQAVERLKKRQERGSAQYAAEACVHSVEEKRQSKYIGEVLAYVRQHYNDPEIGVPFSCTSRSWISKPSSRRSRSRVCSTAWCSKAVEMMCFFPFRAPSRAADRMAWLSASLPPDVNKSSPGSQPSSRAISSLARVSASAAACPAL